MNEPDGLLDGRIAIGSEPGRLRIREPFSPRPDGADEQQVQKPVENAGLRYPVTINFLQQHGDDRIAGAGTTVNGGRDDSRMSPTSPLLRYVPTSMASRPSASLPQLRSPVLRSWTRSSLLGPEQVWSIPMK